MPRPAGSLASGAARARTSSTVVASISARSLRRQSAERPERRIASSLRPRARGFTGASMPATPATMKPVSSSGVGSHAASHSLARSKRSTVGSTAGSR